MAKGAYIGVGGVARKIKKGYIGVQAVTMTNLLPAINGNSGFNAGSSSTVHTKYSSSALMITGNTSAVEVTAISTGSYPLVSGHKYYARFEVYQETVVGDAEFFYPVVGGCSFSGTPVAGQWKSISSVFTRTNTSGNYQFRLDFNNNNNAGYMWFDGVMLVDLTAACGSGNEPTAAWCDANIPYFTGKKTIECSTVPSVARRIKKAYIGIGGVARPCWSGESLDYYGRTTALSSDKYDFAATSVGNYALFGGGSHVSSNYATVEAYDTSLTKSSAPDLSYDKDRLAATSVGNYALFGGGQGDPGSYSSVDAYDTSLTKIVPDDMSNHKERLAATSVGNYALFGFGINVDAYDTSLTKIAVDTSTGRNENLAATTVGNYALFGGGSGTSAVHAYDTSLTRSTPPELSVARGYLAATSVNNYALFGGGSGPTNAVEAYDVSLTRSAPAELSAARDLLAATTVGKYALFGGGYTSSAASKVVDAYGASLTRTTARNLYKARCYLAATTIDNYAMFAGGANKGAPNTYGIYDYVDVYVYSE